MRNYSITILLVAILALSGCGSDSSNNENIQSKKCVLENTTISDTTVEAIAKWSDEFGLGLPKSWEELSQIRGIVTNVIKEDFKRWYPNLDLSNFYFINTRNKRITYIPEEIGYLSNLKELGLGGNQIKEIPESIGNLSNLKKLYLSKNQIREIPESIGNLSNLKKLYLRNNQIKKIPESIGNLSNLQRLDLGGNPLSNSEKEKIKKLLPNTDIWF